MNSMLLDDYQNEAKKTAFHPEEYKYMYPVLGLCSEAGELAGKVKKVIRDDGAVFTEEKKEEIKKELGDVLWYVAQIATEFDFALSDVGKTNLKKLADRQQRNTLTGSGDER